MRKIAALLALLACSSAAADDLPLKGAGLRLIPQTSAPSSFTLGRVGLWSSTSGDCANLPCWRKADGTDLVLGSGGGASTLAALYAAGASSLDSRLDLDATRGPLVLRDNATPIGDLLSVTDVNGSAFFRATSTGVQIGPVTAPADGVAITTMFNGVGFTLDPFANGPVVNGSLLPDTNISRYVGGSGKVWDGVYSRNFDGTTYAATLSSSLADGSGAASVIIKSKVTMSVGYVLKLMNNFANLMYFGPAGISPASSNTIDIGASAATWRSGYFGTSVLAPALDVSAAGALTLGGTTATAISIGRSGITTALAGTVTVDGIEIDTTTGVSSGKVLAYNGTKYVPTAASGGSLQSAYTAGAGTTDGQITLTAAIGSVDLIQPGSGSPDFFRLIDNGYNVLAYWDSAGTFYQRRSSSFTSDINGLGGIATFFVGGGSLGATLDGSVLIQNNNSASGGTPKEYSPGIALEGRAYASGPAASKYSRWYIQGQPQDGVAAITSKLAFTSTVEGVGTVEALTISDTGVITAAAGLLASSLDRASAGALTVGGATATSVAIGSGGITTTINGTLAAPTLSGTVAGTYTLGGTPTLGADLGITTDGTDIGDATHRVDLFALTLNSGASSFTATSTVATGGSRKAFVFNDTNLASTDVAMSIQFGGADKIQFHNFTGNGPAIDFKGTGSNYVLSGGTALTMGLTSLSYYVTVANTDVRMKGGGNLVYLNSTALYSLTDVGLSLGSSSGRWLTSWQRTAIVGDTAANQLTCNSTNRGAVYVVRAAGGASDTFEVCMKAAADTYAWRVVYTAP